MARILVSEADPDVRQLLMRDAGVEVPLQAV
jgi:hypothetical protein